MQSEEVTGKTGRDGAASGAAAKAIAEKKMPIIPKPEPSSPKKPSAEKPFKGAKAPGGKGASAEKGKKSHTGAKAAKGAAANGKAATPVKKQRKVYELPGQTRDTPPEVEPEPTSHHRDSNLSCNFYESSDQPACVTFS